MHSLTLTLHSLIRWFVIIVGILAAGRAVLGWLRQANWTKVDDRLGLLFMIGVDIQVLLGLILYLFLSSITDQAFADFGAAMADPNLRFYAVEHIAYMVVALVLVHLGRSLPKRVESAGQKHRQGAILFGLAVIIILVAIPWERPLFRLG
jgi:Na+-driven multidrug efflux pump